MEVDDDEVQLLDEGEGEFAGLYGDASLVPRGVLDGEASLDARTGIVHRATRTDDAVNDSALEIERPDLPSDYLRERHRYDVDVVGRNRAGMQQSAVVDGQVARGSDGCYHGQQVTPVVRDARTNRDLEARETARSHYEAVDPMAPQPSAVQAPAAHAALRPVRTGPSLTPDGFGGRASGAERHRVQSRVGDDRPLVWRLAATLADGGARQFLQHAATAPLRGILGSRDASRTRGAGARTTPWGDAPRSHGTHGQPRRPEPGEGRLGPTTKTQLAMGSGLRRVNATERAVASRNGAITYATLARSVDKRPVLSDRDMTYSAQVGPWTDGARARGPDRAVNWRVDHETLAGERYGIATRPQARKRGTEALQLSARPDRPGHVGPVVYGSRTTAHAVHGPARRADAASAAAGLPQYAAKAASPATYALHKETNFASPVGLVSRVGAILGHVHDMAHRRLKTGTDAEARRGNAQAAEKRQGPRGQVARRLKHESEEAYMQPRSGPAAPAASMHVEQRDRTSDVSATLPRGVVLPASTPAVPTWQGAVDREVAVLHIHS